MGYFQAVGADRFEFLHDRARVIPLWKDYHERRGKPVPMLVKVGPGRLATLGGKTLAFFEAEFQPGGRKPVALIWEGDRFGFDWESSVVYGSMDWIEWVETRPVEAQLMRVYLSRATLDGLTSVEREDGWREMVAEHPDGLSPVVVRVPPGVGFPVEFTRRQQVPITAEFRFNGARIELVRFHHEGWSR
ncbi:hypothetical protein [Luteolibacter sp. LG18]|uniref:hypothetical protein n=1 Tax=Luteolibacter sp. LG18 TaxID=2819286 RepID=UPI0030C76081